MPTFESVDEFDHMEYVDFVAREMRLPVLNAPQMEVRMEGYQGPLYYLLVAPLYRLVASEAALPRWELRPGYLRSVGPHHFVWTPPKYAHGPEERFPFTDIARVVHILRLVSVVIGMWMLWNLHRLLSMAFPNPSVVPSVAMGWVAFLPSFTLLNSVITNDGLAAAIGTAIITQAVAMTREDLGMPQWVKLGGLAALGALTKLTVLPVALTCALLIVWFRRHNWRRAMIGFAVFLTCFAAISGWWFIRNWWLYGDPSALNMLFAYKTVIPQPEVRQWSYLLHVSRSIFESYWSGISILGVIVNHWVYRGLYVIVAAWVLLVLGWLTSCWRTSLSLTKQAIGIFACAFLANLAGLVKFASFGAGAEGRYLFPTLSAQACFVALALIYAGRKITSHPARTARILFWTSGSAALIMYAFQAPLRRVVDALVIRWFQWKPRAMSLEFYFQQDRIIYDAFLGAFLAAALLAAAWRWFEARKRSSTADAMAALWWREHRFPLALGWSVGMLGLNLFVLFGAMAPVFHSTVVR